MCRNEVLWDQTALHRRWDAGFEMPSQRKAPGSLERTLTTLLNGVSVDLETSRKRIKDALKDFEDDTPLTPPVPIKSIGKRLRLAPSFDEQDDHSPNSGEAQAAASVGSIEELDFLERDQLKNEDACETGYMGRNFQVQWLRSPQGKLRQPEEEVSVSWRQLTKPAISNQIHRRAIVCDYDKTHRIRKHGWIELPGLYLQDFSILWYVKLVFRNLAILVNRALPKTIGAILLFVRGSIARGSGHNTTWVWRLPSQKWSHKMIEAVPTGQQPARMVWASIWIGRGGVLGRSPLVIMQRDETRRRAGYTAWSYLEALEEGLLPHYRRG
ncbi:hypothetical protein yc1106_09479 [Curvularia clavata]|uniref:Uncharacterized protein n=1 Tax=Curvularia clavata TaxID=95742 RepID=A0A9Q8ZI95_CURCL|nr:hypothetical protein yc1106_09479 [Curvularia clavata]